MARSGAASTAEWFQRATLTGDRQAIALISIPTDLGPAAGPLPETGQDIYVRQLADALVGLGWQVDVFTLRQHPAQQTLREPTPHQRWICLGDLPQGEDGRADRVFEVLPAFLAEFEKFQTKQGSQYPLIHTNGWLAAWVGLQLKQRRSLQVVHTPHTQGTESGEGAAIAQRLHIEREILRVADQVVATSPREADQLQRLEPSARIEVVPCGTDTVNFRPLVRSEARQLLGLAETAPVLVYVGRIERSKRIDTLVRAFHAWLTAHPDPSARLMLVGSRDVDREAVIETARIEALVAELGLTARVRWTGYVEPTWLPLYYSAADVCVIPSEDERFGLPALEAIACGTPVVASDVGGLRFTVVPQHTGLLVPPGDVDGFARAIAEVLRHDLWTERLRRQGGSALDAQFTWPGVAAQLSDRYRRCLVNALLGEQVA